MNKRIKILSNPYENSIKFYDYNEETNEWEDISLNNPNSKLREINSYKSFLPFKAQEIIEIIIDEYYNKKAKLEIIFEGNKDEYNELKEVCEEEKIIDKVQLSKDDRTLENARIIMPKIKDSFDNVEILIRDIIKKDESSLKDLNKVSDALKDIIPICVFGNYSSGKSTFINSLIGHEILPSGGDPVTAKIYQISKSKDEDVSRIKFDYDNKEYELLFEENKFRVLSGDKDTKLIKLIDESIESITEVQTMYQLINHILEIINEFEREITDNKGTMSNIIKVEVPFSKEGILGQSYFNYVIFDTPGSNSETNIDHKKVLASALDGFSNGIPVWVSTYETIDSTDNADLCEKINDIKALDKRFTMIVLNKADNSDITEENFTDKQVNEILSFNSVDKMYSSGIYFVSSIMGLGSKIKEKMSDGHYRKVYRSQLDMYNDPEDEDYVTLYKFNIMPKQIKEDMVKESINAQNLVYANSGLLCIEEGIETFAKKYSSYNKCQMFYSFLKEIVKETSNKIESKTKNLKEANDARDKELKVEETDLKNKINDKSDKLRDVYKKESITKINEYIKEELVSYKHSNEDLKNIKEEMDASFGDEHKIDEHKNELDKAKSNVLNDVDIKMAFKEGIKGIKTIYNQLQSNMSDILEKKKEFNETENEVDSKTADSLVKKINEDYKTNALEISEKLATTIKDIWKENTNEFKHSLMEIVSGEESLSSEQKEEISSIIANYKIDDIDNNIEEIFFKSNYLDGMIFGFRIFESEKISPRKLTISYNNEITSFTNDLANKINQECMAIFERWNIKLENKILNNLTKLNPSLREKTAMIEEDNEKIQQLKESQRRIEGSIEIIEKLMSWKNID